ncbi:hypothetical protein NESM_000812500 [Novymonas esmeraldas]|uniref:Uncharacterized protein n=1 Tax=Novymonas esmeraldas TaxID=1808958 RepID=A0AAW0EXG8_9TRYP
MGSDVSVLFQADAPVPSIVVSTQHEVRANPGAGGGAPPPCGAVVERCPVIRVMAAHKAQQVLGGAAAAAVTPGATALAPHRTPPPPPSLSATARQPPPVLLVRDCTAPGALAKSNMYVPVLNGVLAHVAEHCNDDGGGGGGGDVASSAVCPLGVDFDPSLGLGDRLTTAAARTTCAECCKLFFTHLVGALEHVGEERVAGAVAAPQSPRLSLLYLDARSCRLDDVTGAWLAATLIMRAVRRTRPYALVATRTREGGGGSGGGGNFMSLFSPDVRADMMWASLQHILLTHNIMSLAGVKVVLEAFLAEDAMHDVLLQQQGVNPKALKSQEVLAAVTQERLFPRHGSQLLPQLYLVDVRHNSYDDDEVQAVLQTMAPARHDDDGGRGQSADATTPPDTPVSSPAMAPSLSPSAAAPLPTLTPAPVQQQQQQQQRETSSAVPDVSPTEYGEADADSHRYFTQGYAQPPLQPEQEHAPPMPPSPSKQQEQQQQMATSAAATTTTAVAEESEMPLISPVNNSLPPSPQNNEAAPQPTPYTTATAAAVPPPPPAAAPVWREQVHRDRVAAAPPAATGEPRPLPATNSPPTPSAASSLSTQQQEEQLQPHTPAPPQTQPSTHSSVHRYVRLPDEVSTSRTRDGDAAAEPAVATTPTSSSTSTAVRSSTAPAQHQPQPPHDTPHTAPQPLPSSLPPPPQQPQQPLQLHPQLPSQPHPQQKPAASRIKVHSRQASPVIQRRQSPQPATATTTATAAAAAAAAPVPSGLVMSRTARHARSVSPRSDGRAATPLTARQLQRHQQQQERGTGAGADAVSPTRVGAVELQRAYRVLSAQRPDSARRRPWDNGTPLVSRPNTPQQRTSAPQSPGPSSIARAMRLRPELDGDEDDEEEREATDNHSEAGGEEETLDPLLLQPRRYPVTRSAPRTPQQQQHSRHRSHRSDRVQEEPWLDDAYTLSHGRGTSPELLLLSGGGSGQRRRYEIAALAPPEALFAASAARVAPTREEGAARRRHDSPAEAAAARRAAARSPHQQRRRSSAYDGVSARVHSQRHVGNERLARAEYEAATAAEAKARARTHARAAQRAAAAAAVTGGRDAASSRQASPSLRVAGEVHSGRSSASPPASEPPSPSPTPQRPGAVVVVAAATATPAAAVLDTTSASAHTGSERHGLASDSAAAAAVGRPRLSTAGPPHAAPRSTTTSQLRRVTSQRQRRFSEVEEHENAFYTRNRQPRRRFRTATVTATMRAPWALPLEVEEMAKEQQQQQQQQRRGSATLTVQSARSPMQRGDTVPQQQQQQQQQQQRGSGVEAGQAAHHRWSGALVGATRAPAREVNDNGVELVHPKLRTRIRAVL